MSQNQATSTPWNKGKAIGQKAPFSPQQVTMLKALLEAEGNLRDLSLFCVALDTLLRGANLVALTVADVRDAQGEIRQRVTVRPKKIKAGAPPRVQVVELTAYTRGVLTRWIEETAKPPHAPLFTRLNGSPDIAISTRAFRNLVKRWAELVKADPADFSGHSLRRTRAAYIYAQTRDMATCQHLLGHQSTGSTVRYLGVDQETALELARKYEL